MYLIACMLIFYFGIIKRLCPICFHAQRIKGWKLKEKKGNGKFNNKYNKYKYLIILKLLLAGQIKSFICS